MSAPMFVMELPSEPGAHATKFREFAVAQEMICSLETLTPAGQRHMMGKILTVLRGHVGWNPRDSHRNRRVLADLVDRLVRESERLWPDVEGFTRGAKSLLDLLAALA